ncbi:glycosyltransferase family 4 protein [Caldisericum exile]|uniref:glycosyltransferase family 4 protein n=1 Tax=Caldisericum exile TaxID=693075 RepID=UPI003C719365
MKEANAKRILFLTTLDVTIYSFLIPHMKILKSMGYEVEVAASNVGFTDKIEKEGFKVYNLPFRRNPFSISNIKAFLKLYRIMKENNYLMLHTHTPVASFFGRIAGRLVGIPHIVYTAHGFHFHEYGNPLKNFIYYRLEKFAGKFTDVLITINVDDYKVATEKKLIPHGKVVYIKGVGVDLERLNPRNFKDNKESDFLSDNNRFIFVSVGRLEKEKHFDYLIKAFYFVKKHYPNFELLVIGDGEEQVSLKKLSQRISLKDYVRFLGYVKHVEKYLYHSFAFVFTSSREGLPVSVMEAMAMEKPVVAYNIRGVRDLVEDGVNGFLVPFGDIKELSNKIIYLMEHPDIAKEMGKRGREKIEKEFSLNVVLQDMEKLYKKVLEET